MTAGLPAGLSSCVRSLLTTLIVVAAIGYGSPADAGRSKKWTDWRSPQIAITAPTTSSSYTATTSTVALAGTAADDVGVTRVTWYNDRGGRGTASGTTAWSVAAVTLLPGTNTITVRAYDAAGHRARATLTVSYAGTTTSPPAPTADTQAPTVPAGLTASAASASQINLAWSAATDNVGVTGYRVERCQGDGCTSFAQVGTSTGTAFSSTGLAGATAYRYRVRAADAAGNLGSYSVIAAATTSNRPPTISGTPSTSVVANSPYSFTPSASDPDGQTLTFSVMGAPAWASFDTRTGRLGGTPGPGDVGTTEGIVITVADGIGYASLPAFAVVVQPDEAVVGSALVSWVAPTERTDGSPLDDLAGFHLNYGVNPDALEYTIDLANPGLSSHLVEDLGAGTWYFNAIAYDAAGNHSVPSNTVSTTIR